MPGIPQQERLGCMRILNSRYCEVQLYDLILLLFTCPRLSSVCERDFVVVVVFLMQDAQMQQSQSLKL